MTRLLVSVRSAAEAEAALAGGAALIDVKEPDRGALGRADDAVIADVVRAVAGRAPVSAAASQPGGAVSSGGSPAVVVPHPGAGEIRVARAIEDKGRVGGKPVSRVLAGGCDRGVSIGRSWAGQRVPAWLALAARARNVVQPASHARVLDRDPAGGGFAHRNLPRISATGA